MTALKRLLICLFCAAAAQGTSAAVITDVNDYVTAEKPLGHYIGLNPVAFSDFFDLTDHGYNPSSMSVVSATLTFWFGDDESDHDASDDSDPVYIDLPELGLDGVLQHVDVDFSTVVEGAYISGTILASLQSGKLTYEVRSSGADLYLKKGQLAATVSVPDQASTIGLLFGAFVGLTLLRRRTG